MGNYTSRQSQLESELQSFFNRLMQQTTIEKSEIMQLSRKFADLKRVNPEIYTTIANKANRLVQSSDAVLLRGRAITKDWKNLKEVFEEFGGLCPPKTARRPETKTDSLRKSAESQFAGLLRIDNIPKESLGSMKNDLQLLSQLESSYIPVFKELEKIITPKSIQKRDRVTIPQKELQFVYEAFMMAI